MTVKKRGSTTVTKEAELKASAKVKSTSAPKTPLEPKQPPAKRGYLKQSDVPATALEDALRVPAAILDHYAGRPCSPLHLAKALDVDPLGSQFRLLTGASIAFGLTEGGAQAATISVTDLSRRILRSTVEGGADEAKREAVLAPRVFGEFLKTYDGHSFPRSDLAINVLEGMGVPREKAAEVLERIESSARSVGYIEEIKNKSYVHLNSRQDSAPNSQPLADAASTTDLQPPSGGGGVAPENQSDDRVDPSVPRIPIPGRSPMATAVADDARRRKVFITHGKNRDLVEPIKKLLEYGELVPIVSAERQSVSKPVPEKVMGDMRHCGAAIIHVDAERTITDDAGVAHVIINPNVLIEIGAAMAFYGRRFILLVRDGVPLPSNLQGLYEVRYTNETLDAHATIKLLEAIKDIKNYALPTDIVDE